jgi:hypothetical protein
MEAVKKPLTNLQLELLKIFARDLPEQDLLNIRQMLIQYFAKKSMDLADEAWEKKGWTKEDEERFLQEHFRTPYPKK